MTPAELRIPAQPEFVSLARLVIAQAARQAGVGQDRVQDVKIAVAEALANAVRAQSGVARAQIDVEFGASGDGFEVVVRGLEAVAKTADDAVASEPALVEPELSFMLIEGLTDDMTYAADGSSMCLRFVIGGDDVEPGG